MASTGASVFTYGRGLTPQRESDIAMYENDPDDLFEAAVRLSEIDPARGAEALRAIAGSDEFDPDTRFEAAQRLTEVDPDHAVDALRAIVADGEFDPDIRDEAAHRLAEMDPAAWAETFPGIAPR